MTSLTPQSRSEEATSSAFMDGIFNGAIALVPAGLGVAIAMRNPSFVKATNWQSRTALVVMPALFAYGWAAESKLTHKMHEIAQETEHSRSVAKWAQEEQQQQQRTTKVLTTQDAERQLMTLYKQDIENSGVRIVPGNELSLYHKAANYWLENPMKILLAAGVPTVAYIFHGRNQQNHLQLQSKLMHTRVFGQFAVISSLLCIMGFKAYMDANGKYMTEGESEERVEEMLHHRRELLAAIEQDRERQEARDRFLKEAHKHEVERKRKEDARAALKKQSATEAAQQAAAAIQTTTATSEHV